MCSKSITLSNEPYLFSVGDQPEILFDDKNEFIGRLRHTGLVVDRKLSDYEQLEVSIGVMGMIRVCYKSHSIVFYCRCFKAVTTTCF